MECRHSWTNRNQWNILSSDNNKRNYSNKKNDSTACSSSRQSTSANVSISGRVPVIDTRERSALKGRITFWIMLKTIAILGTRKMAMIMMIVPIVVTLIGIVIDVNDEH